MNRKVIDEIVWWIPFRKQRNEVRNFIMEAENIQNNFKNLKSEIISNTLKNFILLTSDSIEDTEKSKIIFKEMVKMVEIEIHSYCNRKCWFCPNSIIDRNTKTIELDEDVFKKIINDLTEINYSNLMTFHRYNEPLSNKELILRRVKYAREALPNAILEIYTNGDYLTKEYIDELRYAGINSMHISYYLKDNETYDIASINTLMNKACSRLNLKIKDIIENNENIYRVLIDYNNMYLTYKISNFSTMGNTRGGTIKNVNSFDNRKFSCFSNFSYIYIDYNGLVMPCCHLRSDIKSHESMILGDIRKNSIFEIFTNKKNAELRKYLSSKSYKEEPCKSCNISSL